MFGMNKCLSNIGHDTLADGGVGIQRGLNDTLRNMRGPGSFSVVLLPFLCQKDVTKHCDAEKKRKLYYFGYSI